MTRRDARNILNAVRAGCDISARTITRALIETGDIVVEPLPLVDIVEEPEPLREAA